MTYVDMTKFDGIVDVESKFSGFEEGMWNLINSHITEWLKDVRIDVYPIDGNIRMELDIYVEGAGNEIVFEMPYEEFFQLRNDEPPDMELFLLAGLKYYREVYDCLPGEECPMEDDEPKEDLNSLLLRYESEAIALYDMQRADADPEDFEGIDLNASIAKRKETLAGIREQIINFRKA